MAILASLNRAPAQLEARSSGGCSSSYSGGSDCVGSLPKLASTGAGQGIQLVSIFQDLAQVEERWGRSSWRTVAASHRAKLFGTGIGDPETLAYVRRLAGEAEFTQASESRSTGGHSSKSSSASWRSLAPAHVLREADPETAILLYGSLPPARLRLRPYYRDRGLCELAGYERSARSLRGTVRQRSR